VATEAAWLNEKKKNVRKEQEKLLTGIGLLMEGLERSIFASTSGTTIEMATIHTKVAAIRNRIARKYRAGIINTRARGRRSTPNVLKQQIVCAQR